MRDNFWNLTLFYEKNADVDVKKKTLSGIQLKKKKKKKKTTLLGI